MKENEKIEDMKLLEEFSNENVLYGSMVGMTLEKYKDLQLSTEHILSDYKRVLKENKELLELKVSASAHNRILELEKQNELLRKDIEGWKKYCEEIEEEQTEMSNKNCQLEFDVEKLQKENEELKQDRNNNYKMIALAQNKMLEYEQGYEDGKKSKKSAVAFAVENQEYYLIRKEIEKLQKENEKLKNQEATARKINELLVQRYSDSIPAQKVKDTIERHKNMCISNVKDYENYFKDNYNELVFRRVELLGKELLSESIAESNERYQYTPNENNQTLKLSQTLPPEPQLPTKTICESFSKKRKEF